VVEEAAVVRERGESGESSAAMEQAARAASAELNAAYVAADEAKGAVDYVAAWWRKHYLQAGHRRLARILLEYNRKKS
jgi:hypothetical protein